MQKSYKNHVRESVNICYERSIKILDFHERMNYNRYIDNRKQKEIKNE